MKGHQKLTLFEEGVIEITVIHYMDGDGPREYIRFDEWQLNF